MLPIDRWEPDNEYAGENISGFDEFLMKMARAWSFFALPGMACIIQPVAAVLLTRDQSMVDEICLIKALSLGVESCGRW